MKVVVHRDVREYWRAVGSFLLQKEAQNCVPVGIVRALLDDAKSYAKYHLFAVEEASQIVGAGWMTPPFPLGLSELPARAISLVVEHASSLEDPITALVAPRATADAFKDAWVKARGCTVAEHVALRVHQTSKIIHPPAVEGTFRQATEQDRKELEIWHSAFIIDCHMTGIDGQRLCDIGLRSGSRYVWQVGDEAVSMVGFTGETPSGVRIGYVYTPHQHRSRGYATALVAAMSQKLLDDGRKFCFLFTDLANPTSNGIYKRIGYQPVGDSMQYTFSGP